MLSKKFTRFQCCLVLAYGALMLISIRYAQLAYGDTATEQGAETSRWLPPWRSSFSFGSSSVLVTPYSASSSSMFARSSSLMQMPISRELSTEENHQSPDLSFYGRYSTVRSRLDYSYHSSYSRSRQLQQDEIIDALLGGTWIMDHRGEICDSATEPWIVFTAGAMGSGKSYTLRHLAMKTRFPLSSFVTVDPDEIRRHLPEFNMYVQRYPERAGELTRKEAGYIAEVLTQAALQNGHNILVDGSLRDSEWYKRYFEELRQTQPNLRIGILHITAPREAVFQRAHDRSKATGRVVPRETLELTLEQVPKSVQVLRPLSDFFCELHNAPGVQDMELRRCSAHTSAPENAGTEEAKHSHKSKESTWESFRQAWVQTCDKERPHRDRRRIEAVLVSVSP